jgi:hypothetical protein
LTLQEPSRRSTLVSAAVLAAVATVFLRVLTRDHGDNAYLWLYLIGAALPLGCGPFLIATALPRGRLRRGIVALGVAIVALIGVLGTALIVLALLIIPSQAYQSHWVLVSHLAGLLLLAPSVLFVIIRHRPRRAAR